MKQKFYLATSIFAAIALFLSACGAQAPTPDAAAISTSAAQTVEAHFTELAASQPTATETPQPQPTAIQATATLGFPPTDTPIPGQPVPTSNGKPCYAATFLADVTIPDGMIVAPGATFTKTWRIQNDGNCVWDPSYALVFSQGDAMGTVTKVPLTKTVYPGQSIDLSVDLTAPATETSYTGYWRIATPYGGTFGVGTYDQALIVKIQVSSNTNKDFGVASVVNGGWTRTPVNGCNANGASYLFSATITVNSAGTINYRWMRSPYDGGPLDHGTIKFTSAGSKTVYFTWSFQPDAIQNIDRSVELQITANSQTVGYGKVKFNFTCSTK